MKTAIIVGIVSVLVFGIGLAVWLIIGSMAKPMYEPLSLRKRLESGKLELGPRREISWGAVRADGSREFTLETNDGLVLAGFARGRGEPVLVVHGGPGYASDIAWKGLEAFENRFRFYYWHQRGSGRSTRPIQKFEGKNFGANLLRLETTLGIAAQLADIERLRQAFGADRVRILGHSFGGFLAALYAAEFPERVESLGLIAPAPMVLFPPKGGGLYTDIEKSLPEPELHAYKAWLKEFFDYGKLFSRTESEMASLNAGMTRFYALSAGLEPEAAAGESELIGGFMMQAVFFSMGKKHDWLKAMGRIACPAVLVSGDLDLSAKADLRQYEAIPGIFFKEIKGGDHFITQDPAGLAPALAEVLP